MTTPRISPVDPPYAEDVQKSFDIIMPPGSPPLNIFRTVARNPRVLSRMVRGGLLDKGSVSIAQRELVILRACAVCGAEYEWGVHVAAFAAKAGLSQEQIADTCAETVDPALWSEEQQALIHMVDELHAGATIPDDAWESLKRFFSEEQIIELIMLAGLYHAVSFVVNGLGVARESFAASFPAQVPA